MSERSVWFSSNDNGVTHLLCTLRAYAFEPEIRLPAMQRESRRTVPFQGLCATKNNGKMAVIQYDHNNTEQAKAPLKRVNLC